MDDFDEYYVESLHEEIDRLQEDCYDLQQQHEDEIEELELRILKNFIYMMPSAYRAKSVNWVVVRDILMSGTSTSGRTSCINKCLELDIKPHGYKI